VRFAGVLSRQILLESSYCGVEAGSADLERQFERSHHRVNAWRGVDGWLSDSGFGVDAANLAAATRYVCDGVVKLARNSHGQSDHVLVFRLTRRTATLLAGKFGHGVTPALSAHHGGTVFVLRCLGCTNVQCSTQTARYCAQKALHA